MQSDTVRWLYTDQALALLSLSTATCVIYDHLTTLEEEVEHVWKRSKWSAIQVMFFINRYSGDAMQLYAAFFRMRHIIRRDDSLCNGVIIGLGYFFLSVKSSMQVIMMYRISSMYNHVRKIVFLLGSSFLLENCCLLAIRAASLTKNAPISPHPVQGVTLCQERSFPRWLFVVWFPMGCFEVLLLALSVSLAVKYHRGIRAARLSGVYSYLTSWGDPRSLAYVLLRDSVTFPCISLSICIANLVIWITLPHIAAQMAFCAAAFIPCIVGPRLILNLREVYYQSFSEECTIGDYWQSTGEEAPHDQ